MNPPQLFAITVEYLVSWDIKEENFPQLVEKSIIGITMKLILYVLLQSQNLFLLFHN